MVMLLVNIILLVALIFIAFLSNFNENREQFQEYIYIPPQAVIDADNDDASYRYYQYMQMQQMQQQMIMNQQAQMGS
jgi:hypothetical protein